MANFRRRLPRHRTPGKIHRMSSWPASWDIQFHRRPKRRKTKTLIKAMLAGRDPEAIAWPVRSNRPHIYYW